MSTSETKNADTATRRRIRVTVTKDSMKAVIVISRPDSEEPPITLDEVIGALSQAGVRGCQDNGQDGRFPYA